MHHLPETEEAVRDVVRDALAKRQPLAIEGGGTKRGLGRPVQAGATLSLRGLSGITLYEPAEMVIGAWAGTPLAEVQAALDSKGQMLAFEPPDLRTLLGSQGEPTIGAVAACGLAGPRRIMAGGMRDSLIGVRFVNGRGEIIKNGGRVMKNVTGLDLVKLQAGAYGTLGVLTEVIFKVVPQPEMVGTLQIEGLNNREAVDVMTKVLASPFEVTGAAHIPGSILTGSDLTFIRIEGFKDQVEYRLQRLRALLGDIGDDRSTHSGAWKAETWAEIRDCDFLSHFGHACVWRISVPPSRGGQIAEDLRPDSGGAAYLDWGGGLVWLATMDDDDALPRRIHAAAARHGGHATLVKAPAEFRARVDVFQPLDPAVQKLQAGLKASFDPEGVLNPGRMYAGV